MDRPNSQKPATELATPPCMLLRAWLYRMTHVSMEVCCTSSCRLLPYHANEGFSCPLPGPSASLAGTWQRPLHWRPSARCA